MARCVSIALLAFACAAPEVIEGPVDVEIIAPDDDGRYGLRVRTLEVDDLSQLTGPTVRFMGRASLVADDDDESPSIEERAFNGYFVERGGVYYATDYESLIAASAYHAFSVAHEHYRRLGLGQVVQDLPQHRVAFNPTIRVPVIDFEIRLGTDNAAAAGEQAAFFLFREDKLDGVPLAVNEGVIAHEFGHAVLNHLATRARGHDGIRADELYGWFDKESVNLWYSVHEGLADVHGVALTGDPDFLGPSAGIYTEALDRDVRIDHVLTEELEREARDRDELDHDPYEIGTVIASAFWTYARNLEALGYSFDDANFEMSRTAFEAARTIELSDAGFRVTDMLTAAVASIDGDERDALCRALVHHFEPVADRVGGCR